MRGLHSELSPAVGDDCFLLTWKSSSQGGWWWCSVARTQVLRNTRVTISQNIHWDLQIFRHFLLMDLFHLKMNYSHTFLMSKTRRLKEHKYVDCWVTAWCVGVLYSVEYVWLFDLLLKTFHPFLPRSLTAVFSRGFSAFLSDFSCNSDWNYYRTKLHCGSLPTVRGSGQNLNISLQFTCLK